MEKQNNTVQSTSKIIILTAEDIKKIGLQSTGTGAAAAAASLPDVLKEKLRKVLGANKNGPQKLVLKHITKRSQETNSSSEEVNTSIESAKVNSVKKSVYVPRILQRSRSSAETEKGYKQKVNSLVKKIENLGKTQGVLKANTPTNSLNILSNKTLRLSSNELKKLVSAANIQPQNKLKIVSINTNSSKMNDSISTKTTLKEDQELKLQFKAGKSKTYSKLPQELVESDEEVSVEDNKRKLDDSTEVQTPVKKKRGRPRKVDSTPRVKAESPPPPPREKHSRRSRKEINYFELANPKILQHLDDPSPKRRRSQDEDEDDDDDLDLSPKRVVVKPKPELNPDGTEVVKPKGKRGRKKKIVVEENAENISNAEENDNTNKNNSDGNIDLEDMIPTQEIRLQLKQSDEEDSKKETDNASDLNKDIEKSPESIPVTVEDLNKESESAVSQESEDTNKTEGVSKTKENNGGVEDPVKDNIEVNNEKEAETTSKKSEVKEIEQPEPSTENKNETVDAKKQNNSSAVSEPSKQNNGEEKKSDENSTAVVPSEESVSKSDEVVEISETPDDSDKEKYKKAGSTATMMGTLFSIFKKDSGAEEDSSAPTSGEKTTAPIKEVINQEPSVSDEVICAICNQNIKVSNFETHKKEIHNNLAWSSQEFPLDINNENFVLCTIKAIMTDKKRVKCDKCGKVANTPEQFTQHWLACTGSEILYVKCAVCHENISKSLWSYHKQRQHNNLAWREGDPPLDLNDQTLVLSILNSLYQKKKPLFCSLCGESKKSVVGFLSHRSICQKTDKEIEEAKVKCEFCSAKMLAVSMQAHIKLVHFKPDVLEQEVGVEETYVPLPGKRTAASKALSVINKLKTETAPNPDDHYMENLHFSTEKFVRDLLQKQNATSYPCKFKNCTYTCTSIDDFCEHSDHCSFKPMKYYVCKRCLLVTSNRATIRKHIREKYNIIIKIKDEDFQAGVSSEDEQEDYREFTQPKKVSTHAEKVAANIDPKLKSKPLFILNVPRSKQELFKYARPWTMEFCEENYSNHCLYNNVRNVFTDWLLLDTEVLKSYLPPLHESCDIARTTVCGFENCLERDYSFKKLGLFDVEMLDSGDSIIFCGGPVTAMAWLPTPYTVLQANQLLAVAVMNDPDKNCIHNINYNEKSLIQFWSYGILRNKQISDTVPTLAFAIAVDYGPVWHLEWCPSGCYDLHIKNRLGLLAVAGSDTFVYIYCIPYFDMSQSGLFYKHKPVAVLQLTLDGDSSFYGKSYFPTKISWTKSALHKFIAVGYSNGMVGLFNISSESILLTRPQNNTEIMLPYKSFQAHSHYISVLSLHHLNEGNRWLLTGSFDKTTTLWDLEQDTKITTFKKGAVADGTWLTHWIAFFTSLQESTSTIHVTSSISTARNFLTESATVTGSLSTISSLTASDWLNFMIIANQTGTIIGFRGNQLVYGCEFDKSIRSSKLLFSYTCLAEKNKTPRERQEQEIEKQKALKSMLKTKDNGEEKEIVVNLDNNPYYFKYEPIRYEQTNKKYGLIFCDSKLDSMTNFPKDMTEQLSILQVTKYGTPKPHLYPLQAVNKVAINPNVQSSTFFASGYQAGFVKLNCLRFLSGDAQVV